MSTTTRHIMKLPDLGEGTVSAEVIAWKVAPGDLVREDAPLVEMSTEKAVVEVPSPVSGRVISLGGKPGDTIAVGAELAVFAIETMTEGGPTAEDAPKESAAANESTPAVAVAAAVVAESRPVPRAARIMASPATRRRAFEAGIDLATVQGSGPQGRILARDLNLDLERAQEAAPGVTEIPVIGIRRLIAQRMSEAKRVAPHFAYVEEVDVTELEALRVRRNAQRSADSPALTYLPFVVRALGLVLHDFPQCNAHYDEARNVILRHAAVHVGIATQTPDGLKVPVVRDVAGRDGKVLGIDELASEIRRVSEAARTGRAKREELSGSTITVTSLGKLGGIVSTPILNLPEVAIIGVNKAIERVVVHDGKITIRRIMNLSSSFDHRFVDGYDAAAMIQALKARLEAPGEWFLE
jgi:2-oxoisovalerate dehydrogenase E2 component (dihydrolipoyl transacylase)